MSGNKNNGEFGLCATSLRLKSPDSRVMYSKFFCVYDSSSCVLKFVVVGSVKNRRNLSDEAH